jgi:hypothetical protein
MKMALQILLKGDGPTHSYLEILKRRLASDGEKLVKKVRKPYHNER